MNKKLYFSLFSGQIYEVPEDEISSLDAHQLPLKERPNKNCKKCFGRLHEGYNITHNHYIPCTKCLKKYLDRSAIKPSNGTQSH